MTVLVTGATGNVGSRAIHALRRRSQPVRAFVRDAARASTLLGDGVELAPGDFEDAASIRRALDGVDRVLLSSADGPRKVEHEAAVVGACAQAGVELIVKASTLSADPASPLPPFAWNGRSEDQLQRSGVPAVILRSAFYMTNVLGTIDDGRLLAPAGRGRVAMIDPGDVGAVAAAVLSTGEHAGRTYRLTGPDPIGFAQAAEALGVEYVDLPPAAAREGLAAAGLPGWLVEHLDGAFAMIRAGELEEVSDTVRTLTGREPRTFAEFAHEHRRPGARQATTPDRC
jgi:uncharacterized protein YbjT (DUF2867 family)